MYTCVPYSLRSNTCAHLLLLILIHVYINPQINEYTYVYITLQSNTCAHLLLLILIHVYINPQINEYTWFIGLPDYNSST
jgi:hypothetical protein